MDTIEGYLDEMVGRMSMSFALVLLAATIYQAVMIAIFLLLLAR